METGLPVAPPVNNPESVDPAIALNSQPSRAEAEDAEPTSPSPLQKYKSEEILNLTLNTDVASSLAQVLGPDLAWNSGLYTASSWDDAPSDEPACSGREYTQPSLGSVWDMKCLDDDGQVSCLTLSVSSQDPGYSSMSSTPPRSQSPSPMVSGTSDFASADRQRQDSGAWTDTPFYDGTEERSCGRGQWTAAVRRVVQWLAVDKALARQDFDYLAQMFTVGDQDSRDTIVAQVRRNFKSVYRQELGSGLLCEMAYISETRASVAQLLIDNVMRCAVDQFGSKFIISCIETKSEHFLYHINWTLVSQAHRLSVLQFGSEVIRKWISVYTPTKEKLRKVFQYLGQVLTSPRGIKVVTDIVNNVSLTNRDLKSILAAVALLPEENRDICRDLVIAIADKGDIVLSQDTYCFSFDNVSKALGYCYLHLV